MQSRDGQKNGAPGKEKATRGEAAMTNTMWRCVQWRAGQILNNVLFNTKAEAETFCTQMRRVEPDIFWRMEPVEAQLVWN